MNKRLIRKLLAEFVGTCFLVMIVIGSGIMAQNLSSDQLTILLANTIATGAGLTGLIWLFISISGAHFNPAVSLIMFLKKELTLKEFSCFACFQFIGGFFGAILANIMFGLEPLQISANERSGLNIYFSELIATFGLIITILGVRKMSILAVGPAVGLYISAGYWFTSSTSFANPAVTIARIFTNTFTGIAPISSLYFLSGQVIGCLLGFKIFNLFENNQKENK